MRIDNYIRGECIIFTVGQIFQRIKYMFTQFCSIILRIRNSFFVSTKQTSNAVTGNRIANNVRRNCNYIFIVVSGRVFCHVCSCIWYPE